MKTDALLLCTFYNSVPCNNCYLLLRSSFHISDDETCSKKLNTVMLQAMKEN